MNKNTNHIVAIDAVAEEERIDACEIRAEQNKWFLKQLLKIEKGQMKLQHLILHLRGICWVCKKNPAIDEAGPGAIDICATCFDKY